MYVWHTECTSNHWKNCAMASGGVPRDNMEMSRFQHGYLVDNTLQYCPEDEDDHDHRGMFEDVVSPVLVNDPTSRAYRCSLYPRPQSGFRWYPANARYSGYPMAAGTSPEGEAPNAAGGIYCDDHRYSYGEACANVAASPSYRIGHHTPEPREPTPRSSCSSEIRTHGEMTRWCPEHLGTNLLAVTYMALHRMQPVTFNLPHANGHVCTLTFNTTWHSQISKRPVGHIHLVVSGCLLNFHFKIPVHFQYHQGYL